MSTTLREPLEWDDSHVITGDVPHEVGRLKQGSGKDIQVIGSGELARTLMEHDLVDEYRLMIHPLVLGGGKRLFGDGKARTALRLLERRDSSTGVLIATYVPADRKEPPRGHLAATRIASGAVPRRIASTVCARRRSVRCSPVFGTRPQIAAQMSMKSP